MTNAEFVAPSIHTFPSTDVAFRTGVTEIYEASLPSTAADLERLLRERFPAAVVHERDPIATSVGDRGPLWYVFREPVLSRWA